MVQKLRSGETGDKDTPVAPASPKSNGGGKPGAAKASSDVHAFARPPRKTAGQKAEKDNGGRTVLERDVESEISALISRIADQADKSLHSAFDNVTQKTLARVLNILPAVAEKRNIHDLRNLDAALSSLLIEYPNLELAKKVIGRLERKYRESSAFFRSPPVAVVLGLLCHLFIIIPSLIAIFSALGGGATIGGEKLWEVSFFGTPVVYFVIVACAGAAGSIVSIMTRIRIFAEQWEVDRAVLFFTGLFKPAVGFFFGLFVLCAIKSELLPFKISAEIHQPLYFFAALAFISGFSERFAKDVIKSVQTKI